MVYNEDPSNFVSLSWENSGVFSLRISGPNQTISEKIRQLPKGRQRSPTWMWATPPLTPQVLPGCDHNDVRPLSMNLRLCSLPTAPQQVLGYPSGLLVAIAGSGIHFCMTYSTQEKTGFISLDLLSSGEIELLVHEKRASSWISSFKGF